MKKLVLTAVIAALFGSALTAAPRLGVTSAFDVNGKSSSVGFVVEEDMFNASLFFNNLSKTNYDNNEDDTAKLTGFGLMANYKHSLDNKNTLLGGISYTQSKDTKEIDDGDSLVKKSTSINLNVGVQRQINERTLLNVYTPVVSLTTTTSDASDAKDEKVTEILNGGVKVGFTFLIN